MLRQDLPRPGVTLACGSCLHYLQSRLTAVIAELRQLLSVLVLADDQAPCCSLAVCRLSDNCSSHCRMISWPACTSAPTTAIFGKSAAATACESAEGCPWHSRVRICRHAT